MAGEFGKIRCRQIRSLIRCAAVLTAVAFVACYTAPTSTTPRPNGHVRIAFPDPLTIAAVGQPGDSLWLRDITSIRGRVTKVAPDTVYLQVTGAGGSSGAIRDIPPGRQAAVARRAGMVVQTDAGGAKQAVGMIMLIGVLALVIGAWMMFSGMPES